MKLVIDMSALSVDKRKMVVDYLQDNDVPITWAGDVNPQMDIYAEVAKELNRLPTVPLKNWGTRERFVGKRPALAAPYTPPLFEHGTKEPKPNPFLVQRAMREARGLELMTEEDFRAQYMCEFRPDPKAWIPHYGGPCPVNHDEVEVELRGDHRPGKDVETRSVKRRGMPESFVWQWGRPTDPTSRNDVLNWRPALPKENTQEWADAEARREQGLEPKRPMRWAAAAVFTPNEVREALIARLVLNCSETLEKLQGYTNSALVSLGKHYRLSPGAWLELTDAPLADAHTEEFRRGSPMQRHAQGLCPDCGHTVEGGLHYMSCPRIKAD